MRDILPWRVALFITGLLTYSGVAHGYAVGPAVSLGKMTEQADIVFKGTAVSSSVVQDASFPPVAGFVAHETRFKLISVLKGQRPVNGLWFRHYDEAPQPGGRAFEPHWHHFEIDRSYLVFATRGRLAATFRQLWLNPTVREDEGTVRCADDKPVTATTVKAAVWSELMTLLGSARVSDVLYGLGQLDAMSGGRVTVEGTADFDRGEALAAARGLITSPDTVIAGAAIGFVGSHNPYLSDDQALFWLATVGGAEVPGIGKFDAKLQNPGGQKYWRDLVTLTDSKAANAKRAQAIRALGLVREPALRPHIERWLMDADPGVRAAATVLLADFPSLETRQRLTALAHDTAPEVRVSAAHATGYAQQAELAPLLGQLIADPEAKVREAAAMSLLSFSPRQPAIATVFRAQLDNTEFQPLFLIALARDNPADYLDGLATAVEHKTEPRNFWGGQIPTFTAWEMLFKYLRAQPVDKVRAGTLDRYLDAMEQVGNYSSSEPRDIYAFYVQRGLTDRAQKFRQVANKAAAYDLDYYFKQVDENPSLYKRE